MAVCRTCRAPIRFVRMQDSGTQRPVDPLPDRRGPIIALPAPQGRYVDGRYLCEGEGPGPGEVRLMPHFATCASVHRPPRARPSALFDCDPLDRPVTS